VVFESGWQHFADTPRSYGRSPGRPLLRAVPTVWDDTVLLGGYPGEWAALARRAGRDWFLGVINGDAARTVELPLDLLGPGNYRATTYRDGASGTIVPAPATFAASDTLQLDLPPGGGWAAHLVAPPLSELPLVPRAYLPLIGALSPSR
jgi:alpha-glucosidase